MIIYLKRLKSSKFVRVKAFPMYGGIGVSAPSLHRESTDSLILEMFTNDTVSDIHHLNYSTNYSFTLIASNCAGNSTTMMTIIEGEFNIITLH